MCNDSFTDCCCYSWSLLNFPVAHCNTLQHTATHCNTLQHTATHCHTLQHTATHCNTLQHTATHCNTLQHIATHCTTFSVSAKLNRKTSYIWHDPFICFHDSVICVTRFIYMRVMAQTYIHMWAMLFSYVPHELLQYCYYYLRLVGSLKLYVSFAKEPYQRDDVLQKRPIIFFFYMWHELLQYCYGVATIGRLLETIGLFCRIQSLL